MVKVYGKLLAASNTTTLPPVIMRVKNGSLHELLLKIQPVSTSMIMGERVGCGFKNVHSLPKMWFKLSDVFPKKKHPKGGGIPKE